MPRLLLAPLLLASCANSVDYATGRVTVNDYSIDEEVRLGTRLATAIIAATEANDRIVDADDEITRTVWRVVDRLLSVPENRARMPVLPWEVHVVDAEVPNAWCFPGGQLLVVSGLLRAGLARDEDEVAALLGHELGHAAARHGTEKLTLAALDEKLGPFGRFLTPRLLELAHPDTPARIQQAFEKGSISYDIVQELEADILGLEMMARAGYEPARAAEIWRRWATDARAIHAESHPSSEERERVLRDHVLAARYIAARRSSSGPPPARSWRWTEATLTATRAARSIPDRAPLPDGPRIRSRLVIPPIALLDASIHVLSGPEGEALRASVDVSAGRDLREDALPFSAELWILEGARVVDHYALADRAPLDRASVPIRVALRRLPPGRFVARARVTVGALVRVRERGFDVGTRTASATPAGGGS